MSTLIENLPQTLIKKVASKSYVYDDISQPFQQIQAFFECAWLSNHLVMLKYWCKLVSTKACYTQKDCPADLIYTHKMFCNLINAVWLLKALNTEQNLNLEILSPSQQQHYLRKEKLLLKDYPAHLSDDELLNPYLVIQHFFKAFKLKSIHQHLYLWLNEGLSPFSFIDDTLTSRKVYKQLRRLFEACWLIHEREIKKHTSTIYQEAITVEPSKPLQHVVNLLINVIPIDTIYNLSKDETNPDLMIVLDKSCNKAYSSFEPLIEMTMLGFEKASCTVHNYGHLKELIHKGHLFYSIACNASNIIYQQNEGIFAQLNVQQLEWVKNEVQPVFDLYMAKAIYFYKGAQQYLKDGVNYMAIFMLQQACEHTYRCLLKVLRGKDLKCHAPAVLRKYVKRYAPEVIGIFSVSEEEEINYLNILEEAYIKARYEQTYAINVAVLEHLNEKVGLLQEIVVQSFKDKIQILENAVVKPVLVPNNAEQEVSATGYF